jgi:hypothetical protein
VKEQTQEATLAEKFHELMHTLTVHEIPTVLLHFPRLVEDPDYLYRQLKPILTDVALKDFSSAFARVAQPELVHDFSDRSPAASDQPETRRR